MFRRKTPELDTLSCDTTRWEIGEESPSHRIWVTPEKACVKFQFTNAPPTLPFDVTNLDDATEFYDNQSTQFGGAMISVDVAETRDLEFLRGLFKYRSPEPGSMAMYFVGIIVIPFETFSYQINTEALEVGTTGMREAAVMALGDGPPVSDEPPQVVEDMDDFLTRSRATTLRRIPADDSRYDDSFPDHPLSQVRRLQSHVITTLTFPDWLVGKPRYRTYGT